MEDLEEEEDNSDMFRKDSESGTGKKGLWDKRCMTVGVVVLVLIVCGAIAAILMHRFTGKGVVTGGGEEKRGGRESQGGAAGMWGGS